MIYLAQPFKHKKLEVEEARFNLAVACAAELIQRGYFVYSPIVNSYPQNKTFVESQDFSFWRPFDFHMLSKADQLWIMKIEGWRESVGLAAEIDFAKAMGISSRSYSPTHKQLEKFGIRADD